MISQQIESLPYSTPILQNGKDLISSPWYQWFFSVAQHLGQTPQAVETATTTTPQSASIAATPALVTQTGGLYRVSYYLRITKAAGVSSSVTVTIGWTESGIPLTLSGAALTTNTVTSVQSNTWLVRADGATSITYATTYVSNPAADAQYRLDVVVEQVA